MAAETKDITKCKWNWSARKGIMGKESHEHINDNDYEHILNHHSSHSLSGLLQSIWELDLLENWFHAFVHYEICENDDGSFYSTLVLRVVKLLSLVQKIEDGQIE